MCALRTLPHRPTCMLACDTACGLLSTSRLPPAGDAGIQEPIPRGTGTQGKASVQPGASGWLARLGSTCRFCTHLAGSGELMRSELPAARVGTVHPGCSNVSDCPTFLPSLMTHLFRAHRARGRTARGLGCAGPG